MLRRGLRVTVVFALLVAGAFAYQWWAASSLTASQAWRVAAPTHAADPERRDGGKRTRAPAPAEAPGELPADAGPRAGHGALGEADGALPDGTSVFDDRLPGIANLDASLRSAVQRAAADASAARVHFVVDSGWRSAAYQEQLRREAVAQYGSEEEAARWVAASDRSAHVSGDAIDLGPKDAASWLAEHGAAYGLCRVYANEPWHYELRPDAAAGGCPALYDDPTYDPRLQP